MKREEYNQDSVNAIAVLLEFYDKGELGWFRGVCAGYGTDMIEAFTMLKDILMNYLAVADEPPDFGELAGMYADRKGIRIEEFAKHL